MVSVMLYPCMLCVALLCICLSYVFDSVCELFGETISSFSSCHQTAVFHCSTLCFAVSLSCRRSSKEQECARSRHSNICQVFSDETPKSHVVSPLQ